MRFIVIILLVGIVLSLFSALVFVYRDSGRPSVRAVKALTVRVALSLALFLLLIAGHHLGWFGDKL